MSKPPIPSPDSESSKGDSRHWLFHFAILQPLVLWVAWAQWKGMTAGLLNHRVVIAPDHLEGQGVLEFWVHGSQPWFEWVPFIHPPGYTVFMNLSAMSAETFGGFEQAIFQGIFWQGVLWKSAGMALFTWAVTRWKSPKWGLFAATLYAFSPNTLRPFEHYPLASLLSALAVVAIVEWGIEGTRTQRRNVVVIVLAAVLLHLSIWFVVGGLVAGLFFLIPARRREIALTSVTMIGLFFCTTYPGLYEVIAGGSGNSAEKTWGVLSIEWTNPVLLASSFLVFLPWLWKQRVGLALGCSVLLFTTVTLTLQFFQLADGQPYPFSLHYFELVEPAMILAAVWGLAGLRSQGGWLLPKCGTLLAGVVLLSQTGFFLYCQKWVFLHIHWFWVLMNPLSSPP